MSDEQDYPDTIVPYPPDGFKKLEPIDGQKRLAPDISWGSDYQKWPERKKRRYAERLAASMNHAADLLQTERNKLLEVVAHKEEQVKAAAVRHSELSYMIQTRVTAHNAEKQDLYKQIMLLQTRVAALEHANENLSKKLGC